MRAWHFLYWDGTMRNGEKPPPDGEWLEIDGDIELCRRGLHASERIIDALRYSPGFVLCRVEVEGCRHGRDKLVARRRKILWRMNAGELLRDFARKCALEVTHLWNAPEDVIQCLKTGDVDDCVYFPILPSINHGERYAILAADNAIRGSSSSTLTCCTLTGDPNCTQDKINRRLTSMVMAQRKAMQKED